MTIIGIKSTIYVWTVILKKRHLILFDALNALLKGENVTKSPKEKRENRLLIVNGKKNITGNVEKC